MDDADPMNQFFPSSSDTSIILYETLKLTSSASGPEIRTAYRRLALKFHPDKQSNKSEKEKEELSKEFQRVGFAYAVLSDEKRRKR